MRRYVRQLGYALELYLAVFLAFHLSAHRLKVFLFLEILSWGVAWGHLDARMHQGARISDGGNGTPILHTGSYLVVTGTIRAPAPNHWGWCGISATG